MPRRAAIAEPPPATAVVPTLAFERDAWSEGAVTVAGVDEVGVGPLAGPVTSAAVLLTPDDRLDWFADVRDSKVLTAAAREELDAIIRVTVPFGLGWCSNEEIDRIGIMAARRQSVLRALDRLPRPADAVISDALQLPLPKVRAEVRADAQSVSVAAASIVAKVARDRLMTELCERIPGYGFCQNKGYSTPGHRRAIERRGPSEAHRVSWAPFAQYTLDL